MPILRSIKFEVNTPNGEKFSYDLLDKRYLNKFGISRSDIRESETIFAFPDSPYLEEGVAKENHPLFGSACNSFTTYEGIRRSIDLLLFFDFNPLKSHFDGDEHYNLEIRFSEGGKIIGRNMKKVEGHAFPAYPFLYISLDPGPRGTKVKKKVFRP